MYSCTKDTDAPAGWQVISTDGLGDKSNAYTWAMTQLGDYLLMGTFNSGLYGGIHDPLPIPLDGRAQLLFTTDGLTWDTLVNDGFGEPLCYQETIADRVLVMDLEELQPGDVRLSIMGSCFAKGPSRAIRPRPSKGWAHSAKSSQAPV